MKKWMSFVLLMLLCSALFGQAPAITKSDLKKLHALDDSLQLFGGKMLDEALATDRLRADSMFTRLLVRALRIPHSFQFQFDSMDMAPMLYPDDSSFRIITWHLPMNEDNFRQKGVIQMHTTDGSLKMFPLFDASDYSEETLLDSIRTNQAWIGAVYYKIIQHEADGIPVYTMLGYDENNERTTRKWIDILTFNDLGEPQWGGDYFSVPGDSILPVGSKRFMLEYKKEGRARINYDEEDSLIVIDNLVSETGEPEKKYTLIPGGDYEAFKWENGKWKYIDKLFMEARGDGNEPKPMLILDENGNANEDALQKQTEKNLKAAEAKEKQAEAAKPTVPKATETKPKTTTPAKKKTSGKG